jgi:putative sterol carrier protein
VAPYLSAEWFTELQALLDGSAASAGIPDDVNLSIQQLVTASPAGDVAYTVVVAGGRIQVRPGTAEAPDLAITQDHVTALAVISGTLPAASAFMSGRIRVSGNMGKLLEHQAALQAISEAIGTLGLPLSHRPTSEQL